MKSVRINIIFLLLLGSCEMDANEKNNQVNQLRRKMIETIERYGVKNSEVIRAMEKVPRHEFVPDSMKEYAYDDGPLPIGEGQTISQPYIVAYMTEKLKLDMTLKVLEIGTGSGYQAAVLGEIAKEVYTIEIHKPLCTRAQEILKKLEYKNVFVKCDDGYLGWPEKAPFDRIILTAAPAKIPQPLMDQLAPGGILIAPIGVGFQDIQVWEKSRDGKFTHQSLIPVRFVPMTGKALKE
ncbi:MAG: protein-L-isoaspartate(D-aspartate) O-methyltransferase [Bacteriovoracales bacterium]